MPRTKKGKLTKNIYKKSDPVADTNSSSFMDRVQGDLQNHQSILNIILGTLVVLVLAVLVFNFFSNRTTNNETANADLGPTQQTANETTETQQPQQDVSKENLPGKYTVKSGDTLFLIAQSYYNDGYKYDQIASANKLSNPNQLEVGQVLEIPKLEGQVAGISIDNNQQQATQGTGGAENQTIWGEKITGDTYTVQEGDWLSKVAGRAYGDIMQYQKIADANNITDVNVIEPGTVIKIPR